MLSKFILNVKRRETFFYGILYKFGKFIITFNLPVVKIIHLPLYHLNYLTKVVTKRIIHIFWSTPLFRARCSNVGKGLKLPNGIPLVVGGHLKIYLGDNVTIARSTIGASKIFDEPVLKIGNNSTIGYGTVLSVAREVNIGNNCMIAPNCIIMDSDDHPVNPKKRLLGEGLKPEEVLPVKIGDNVWIGSYCSILKGVTIGENSIISANSVIVKDVLPNCVYAGNPARPTLRDIDKK